MSGRPLLRAICRAAGIARIVEVADRRYRVVLAAGAAVPADALEALSSPGMRIAPLSETEFELDASKRAWGEILRVFGRLPALATGALT